MTMYQPDQLQDFLEAGDLFLKIGLGQLSQAGLLTYGVRYKLDHVAFMTSDRDEYLRLRALLLNDDGREVKSHFGSVMVSGLLQPIHAALPESIRPDPETDKVEVDVVEVIYRPSEGGDVSTFHHVGLKPVNKVGADQLACLFPNAQPQRITEWLDGSEGYDVLLETVRIRISETSLYSAFGNGATEKV